jgi:Kef-type K+ transport system membrane component KefB
MELIVLNVGYDLGILSPQLYTIMVLMALVTTMMTGPLLMLIERTGSRIPHPASRDS